MKRSRRDWSRVVADHAASGKTVQEYCESEGIHPNTFYKNRKTQGHAELVEIRPRSNVEGAVLQPQGNQQLRFVITNRISPHITAGRKAGIRRRERPSHIRVRNDSPLSIQKVIPLPPLSLRFSRFFLHRHTRRTRSVIDPPALDTRSPDSLPVRLLVEYHSPMHLIRCQPPQRPVRPLCQL